MEAETPLAPTSPAPPPDLSQYMTAIVRNGGHIAGKRRPNQDRMNNPAKAKALRCGGRKSLNRPQTDRENAGVTFPTLSESEVVRKAFLGGGMDILSADSKDIDHAIQGVPSTRIQSRLETAGIVVSRYGLVVVLLLVGVLKFTPGEAAGIQP